MTYEEFIKNYLYTDTAERNFQTAIQAALDIASIILADQSARLPKEYKDIFPALAEIGVLLRERMAANTRSGGLSLLTHPLSEHV